MVLCRYFLPSTKPDSIQDSMCEYDPPHQGRRSKWLPDHTPRAVLRPGLRKHDREVGLESAVVTIFSHRCLCLSAFLLPLEEKQMTS
ncbi:hypothetical protein TcWFU_006239 [Taenia crassiceps]|uniref:Uncharacterized protein n=1 Tax=Taenia crassiceps TaxID=6207 RepID=A0ABR4QDZ9_9CEST